LPEDQKLGVLLTIEIAPCVLRSMIDMYIFEYFVPVHNVLRLKVFLHIHRSFVAKSKRVVVQRSPKRLPYCDVLDSSIKQILRVSSMSSLDLSDQIIRSSVDMGHDVGLPVCVLLPC
jgi:hypothetical protein